MLVVVLQLVERVQRGGVLRALVLLQDEHQRGDADSDSGQSADDNAGNGASGETRRLAAALWHPCREARGLTRGGSGGGADRRKAGWARSRSAGGRTDSGDAARKT